MIFKKKNSNNDGTRLINIKSGSEYDIYIGRPSKYGNPFSHKSGTLAKYKVKDRDAAIKAYKEWLLSEEGKSILDGIEELRGKVLGCWCYPKKCHGDILIEILNKK